MLLLLRNDVSILIWRLLFIRFIFLDEETTHKGGQGCTYYYNPESPTGFTPRLTKDSEASCPDMDVIEDFDQEEPERVFFGDDQLNWFKEQLMKPSDLTFVVNGGPNFEIDYGYNSLTEFPAEKRKLIELLRETGAEHVIFVAGMWIVNYASDAPISLFLTLILFVLLQVTAMPRTLPRPPTLSDTPSIPLWDRD